MSQAAALNWRYATKQFDQDRKISTDDLQQLTEAVRLAPSSLGLQPYRLLVVTDPQLRASLVEHSYGQAKVAESAALLVFAVDLNINDDTINNYLDLISEVRNCSRSDLSDFESMCKGFVGWRSPEQRMDWASKQAYLGLGVLLTVAANLKIDVCPMEGFVASEYDAALGLDKLGLTATVIATVGYRSENDIDAALPKVRIAASDFVIHG